MSGSTLEDVLQIHKLMRNLNKVIGKNISFNYIKILSVIDKEGTLLHNIPKLTNMSYFHALGTIKVLVRREFIREETIKKTICKSDTAEPTFGLRKIHITDKGIEVLNETKEKIDLFLAPVKPTIKFTGRLLRKVNQNLPLRIQDKLPITKNKKGYIEIKINGESILVKEHSFIHKAYLERKKVKEEFIKNGWKGVRSLLGCKSHTTVFGILRELGIKCKKKGRC